jgi:hypothetical protein
MIVRRIARRNDADLDPLRAHHLCHFAIAAHFYARATCHRGLTADLPASCHFA